jgi:hypothetical protein
MIHNNEVGDNTPGYRPKHKHEAWQLRDHADGGKYCGACGDRIPTDGRTSVPPDSTQLQVFMTHDAVIDAFLRWVHSHGWELQLIPRFGEDDDTYVPTHMIVPQNLDALMAQRRAEYRAQMNVDGVDE